MAPKGDLVGLIKVRTLYNVTLARDGFASGAGPRPRIEQLRGRRRKPREAPSRPNTIRRVGARGLGFTLCLRPARTRASWGLRDK